MVRMFYNLPAYKNVIIPLCSTRVKRRRAAAWGKETWRSSCGRIRVERDSMVPYRWRTAPAWILEAVGSRKAMALRPEVLLLMSFFRDVHVEVAATLPMLERLNKEGVSIIMVDIA